MRQYVDKYEKNPLPVVATSLFMSTGFAVNEAIKIVLGFENPAYNRFMFFNQRGTAALADTPGYKAMTYNFSDHFRRLCLDQGFDWDMGWRGNFLEELVITPDPGCPLCGNKGQEKQKSLEKQIIEIKSETEAKIKEKDARKTVALLLNHDVNRAVAIIAALKSGITLVPLDPQSPPDSLSYWLEDAEARIILADEAYLPLAEKLRKKVNQNIKVINVDDPGEVGESAGNSSRDYLHQGMGTGSGTPAYILYSPGAADLETRPELPFNASWRELYRALLEGDRVYDFDCAQNRENHDSRPFPGNLREYLSAELPDYMIPSYFVPLDKIPLTPNGKLNRDALPEPGTGDAAREELKAPRSEVEEKLAGIWSEVLGIEKDTIGIDSNFFEIGGHSLNAAVMVARVHKELNLKLSLAEVFGVPTLKDIASLVSLYQWTGESEQDAKINQEEEEVTL